MTTPPETEWLSSLAPADRARFLASLSHHLTISLRLFCAAAAPMEKIGRLNEVHHRVSAYLWHCHSGDEDPTWIPAVVGFAFDHEDAAVHAEVRRTWTLAKENFYATCTVR